MGWFTSNRKPSPSDEDSQGNSNVDSNQQKHIVQASLTCHDDPEDSESVICIEQRDESSNISGKNNNTSNRREFKVSKHQLGLNLFNTLLMDGIGAANQQLSSPQPIGPVQVPQNSVPSDPIAQLFGGLFGSQFLNDRGMFGLRTGPSQVPQPTTPPKQPSHSSNYFYRGSKPDEKIYDL